jgi:catechol 2,3-dioxygenase-like lactoylglutathione lyase family enzyme
MRLRQVALVGADLARSRADIEAVLGLGRPYADPGVRKYGLDNAVWPVGDTFLEVVSPTEPGTTAGRLMEKRGGDGGYMAIFQTEDLDAARARATAAGVRVVDQVDRPNVAMTHLHPRDIGGAIVSIDRMVPTEHWEWGGPQWRDNVRTEVSHEIVGAELQGDDPAAMARRWGEVLGCPVERAGDGWRIPLEGGELRFVRPADGRGEGLGAFDVKVADAEMVRARARARGCVDADGEIMLCGTRVRLA